MKKLMKKAALVLVGAMVVCLLGGCGNSFDASAYVKALLDNSYKNDSTGFVEMKLGTAEEAATIYEQGIDVEMEAMLAQTDLTEEQAAEYRKVFSDVFASVKYTVGEAEKQNDGSFVVNIAYEQMNVFAPAMEAYMTQVQEKVAAWTEASLNGEDVVSQEELMAEVTMLLKTCMEESLANVTYDEEATTTIRVEIVDNLWTPNQTDIANLEGLLFDVEEMASVLN